MNRLWIGILCVCAGVALLGVGPFVAAQEKDKPAVEIEYAIRLWQVSSGLPLLEFPKLEAPIHCVTFSPDGERLSAALHDGSIRTWYAPKVETLSPFRP